MEERKLVIEVGSKSKETIHSVLRDLAEEASWWADEIESGERTPEASELVQKYVKKLQSMESK